MTPDELYEKLLNTPIQQREGIARQIIAREDCYKYHFNAYCFLSSSEYLRNSLNTKKVVSGHSTSCNEKSQSCTDWLFS